MALLAWVGGNVVGNLSWSWRTFTIDHDEGDNGREEQVALSRRASRPRSVRADIVRCPDRAQEVMPIE